MHLTPDPMPTSLKLHELGFQSPLIPKLGRMSALFGVLVVLHCIHCLINNPWPAVYKICKSASRSSATYIKLERDMACEFTSNSMENVQDHCLRYHRCSRLQTGSLDGSPSQARINRIACRSAGVAITEWTGWSSDKWYSGYIQIQNLLCSILFLFCMFSTFDNIMESSILNFSYHDV